jgi:hypothetical protein
MSKNPKEVAFNQALERCINAMLQDDACGQSFMFERFKAELFVSGLRLDALIPEVAQRYEMILFDGGNSAGDRWKHVFFPQLLEHYFVDENPLSEASGALHQAPKTVGELMQSLPFFADEHIEDELAELELDCPVDEDCAKVLRKAADLIGTAVDVREQLIAATVRQMNIFYFG